LQRFIATARANLGEKAGEACSIAAEVAAVVATWRGEAAKAGLTQAEISRMASAFDHEDLKSALALRTQA
jgi:serine/threonine-protein kinase HipA